jgi:hypothetical protein
VEAMVIGHMQIVVHNGLRRVVLDVGKGDAPVLVEDQDDLGLVQAHVEPEGMQHHQMTSKTKTYSLLVDPDIQHREILQNFFSSSTFVDSSDPDCEKA